MQQTIWNTVLKYITTQMQENYTVVNIFRNSELEIKPSPLTSILRKALIRSSSVVAGSLRHMSQKSSNVSDSTMTADTVMPQFSTAALTAISNNGYIKH